eukprot:COSAG02_NODE_42990_length_379_cov_0.739286_1_plen_67_part_01
MQAPSRASQASSQQAHSHVAVQQCSLPAMPATVRSVGRLLVACCMTHLGQGSVCMRMRASPRLMGLW